MSVQKETNAIAVCCRFKQEVRHVQVFMLAILFRPLAQRSSSFRPSQGWSVISPYIPVNGSSLEGVSIEG